MKLQITSRHTRRLRESLEVEVRKCVTAHCFNASSPDTEGPFTPLPFSVTLCQKDAHAELEVASVDFPCEYLLHSI